MNEYQLLSYLGLYLIFGTSLSVFGTLRGYYPDIKQFLGLTFLWGPRLIYVILLDIIELLKNFGSSTGRKQNCLQDGGKSE